MNDINILSCDLEKTQLNDDCREKIWFEGGFDVEKISYSILSDTNLNLKNILLVIFYIINVRNLFIIILYCIIILNLVIIYLECE